jgi:4-amino-4-deoxy-L-arabinose transferase-like glycosyltransferase
MSARRLNFAFFFLLAIFAFSATAILYISTPAGAGLANDSVAYIAGARSILQGKGYSDIWLDSTLEAITHYPPLLSLSLSALGLLGIDPLRGARLLNILLFGVNTTLVGLLGWRMTRSRAAGLWVAGFFLLNASLLRVHVFAMSEPLFLFLSLLAFLLIDIYIAGRQKPVWLILAGLAAGLAFLTRYSALALLPTFIVALFLFRKDPAETPGTGHQTWRAGLAATGLFLVGAIPPIAAWFLRNSLVAGNATNRTFQFHPITPENIQPGFYNLSQFLMPVEPWRQVLAKSGLFGWIIAILGLIMLYWLAVKTWEMIFRPAHVQPAPVTFTTTLYLFAYLGAVLFSMSFFDASTKLQPRILAPLYVAFMLLLAAFGIWLWRQNKRLLKGLVTVLAVVALAISAYGDTGAVADFKTAGQGYASWKWHDSLVMASLRDLPADITIYTNTPPAVYLVTGRASRVIPTPIDPVDNLARGDFEQNVGLMRTDLMSGKAVLALFDTSNLEDAPGMQDITALISGLTVLQKAQGDILYGKP